jgi:fructose-1,6-bisphosphatase-3
MGSKVSRHDFYQEVASSPFQNAILELVTASNDDKIVLDNVATYQKSLITSYREQGLQEELIAEMVRILKNIAAHRYVINGDIPDRGPDTARILDYLMGDKDALVNWGNHDLMWIGAAAGSRELICELTRIQLRYNNYPVLEDDYGISLAFLASFARKTYLAEPAKGFASASPSAQDTGGRYDPGLVARMQKAIAVILWKLEAARSSALGAVPYFAHVRRNENGLVVQIAGRDHVLLDQDFPTFDVHTPAALTNDERNVLDGLCKAFAHSKRLQRHMRFLAEKGSMYRILDGVLSFHAIVPVTMDGTLDAFEVLGEHLAGRALFDRLNTLYSSVFREKRRLQEILDLLYRGWKGPHSWTFGKSSMETFTRALVEDAATHAEKQSPYYTLLADPARAEALAQLIMDDFTRAGAPSRIEKIFNGHIPVKAEKEKNAVRANGKVICGDGGFSEAYGDIGFILITTSSGLYLNRLGHSVTAEEVLAHNADILPTVLWEEKYPRRKQLADCNIGEEVRARIAELRHSLAGADGGHSAGV